LDLLSPPTKSRLVPTLNQAAFFLAFCCVAKGSGVVFLSTRLLKFKADACRKTTPDPLYVQRHSASVRLQILQTLR
jgi:hypothetical protein